MGYQRIVSKLGDLESFGADPRRVVYAGHNVDGIDEVDFAGKYQTATGNIKERYQSFDLEYKGEENNDYVNGQGFCCTDNPLGRDGARTVSDTKDGETPERLIYFYHSDHLGSSSLITNFDGEVTQHVEYIPYGEVFLEERNNTWNTPYLFNAKELDEETGLYYYGARYLNPMDAMWLSVDPLFEKYVGMSPYNYCAGNPVKLMDPDGNRTFNIIDGEEGVCTEEIDDGVDAEFDIVREDFNILKETFDNHKDEYEDYLSQLSLGSKGYDVALSARRNEGSSDYAYNVEKSPIPANYWKCNLFVYDMLTENNVINKIKKGQTIPQAKDYTTNNNTRLKGLDVVTDGSVHLGDIIAGKHDYSDASGHVEIVTKIYPQWMEKNFETTAAHEKEVYRSNKGYEMFINSDGHYNPVVIRRSH